MRISLPPNQPPKDDKPKKNTSKKTKKSPVTNEAPVVLNQQPSETSQPPVTPNKPPSIINPKNTHDKWGEFLDRLEKKYQTVNPGEILNPNPKPVDKEVINESSIKLNISEMDNQNELQENEESGILTPSTSENDEDYVPEECECDEQGLCNYCQLEEQEDEDDEEDDEDEDEDEDDEEDEEDTEEEIEMFQKLLESYLPPVSGPNAIPISDNKTKKPATENTHKDKTSNLTDLLNIFSSFQNKSNDNSSQQGKASVLLVMPSLNSDPGFGGLLNKLSNQRKRGTNSSETNDLKRQKMDAIDREYKSFLTSKDKDEYEYFCGLELEEKTNILEQEKIVKELSSNKLPLRLKVITSSLPTQIKGEVIRKLASSKCGFSGNPKMMDWIEHIMRVPWNIFYPMPITINDNVDKVAQYMTSIYSRMDQAVFGHNETKCHIMQIIGKWITNPSAVGNCLALQGPMGVGKTTLVKEGLAPALGRPFNFISLGGATDSSFLDGHSFTYEGSIPGQIVEVVQRSKCMNPIIYFDELDKISKSHRGEEIANLLIHITDTQQNDKFHDKYFGNIDIDLSKVFFVFSYNHDENVHPILRDRLQIVRVKGYNTEQKCKISIEYMFPRFCKDVGFKEGEIKITDEVINYLINSYAEKEEGVRNLGRCLETMVNRLNMLRLVQRCDVKETSEFLDKLPFAAKKIPLITNNFLITREIVENILERPKVETFHHMYL
jgi:ATP-dependent Lon protease